MLILISGLMGLLVVAVLSATAAYQLSKSEAWQKSYNPHGMGLAIEVVFAFLLFFSVLSVAMIMRDAFNSLYFAQGWRSAWYLGAAGVLGGGVLIYMNVFAPRILAREQKVDPAHLGRQCRVPYLLYTPYSVIIWVALILPLVAMVYSSIRLDHSTMAAAMTELTQHSTLVSSLADQSQKFDPNALVYYQLEYHEAVSIVQTIVNRYLWVVGTFMVFLIVMLNTKITTIFTEEAQDFFKWLMWLLLLVAMGIGLYGLWRFHMIRSLAMTSFSELLTALQGTRSLDQMVAVKEQIILLQDEGTISFLRKTLDGGGLWLLFFSYASQIVLAKVTNRSVLKIIFPRSISSFLDGFMLVDEES